MILLATNYEKQKISCASTWQPKASSKIPFLCASPLSFPCQQWPKVDVSPIPSKSTISKNSASYYDCIVSSTKFAFSLSFFFVSWSLTGCFPGNLREYSDILKLLPSLFLPISRRQKRPSTVCLYHAGRASNAAKGCLILERESLDLFDKKMFESQPRWKSIVICPPKSSDTKGKYDTRTNIDTAIKTMNFWHSSSLKCKKWTRRGFLSFFRELQTYYLAREADS